MFPERSKLAAIIDGKLAITDKRETTGPAAKLVMKADRRTINADGEEVPMFAVEVRDGHNRIVTIRKNEVSFTVQEADSSSASAAASATAIPPTSNPTRAHRDRPSLRKRNKTSGERMVYP